LCGQDNRQCGRGKNSLHSSVKGSQKGGHGGR